jgi:hypothetical protein
MRWGKEGWGSCDPRIFILISRPKVALSIFSQGKHVLARIGSTANANVEAFLVPSLPTPYCEHGRCNQRR